MKFCVVYDIGGKNTTRDAVFNALLQFIKQGRDLSLNPVQLPYFQSITSRPSNSELLKFPLNLQCEEMIFDGQELKSIWQLIIDVEEPKIDNNQLEFNFESV